MARINEIASSLLQSGVDRLRTDGVFAASRWRNRFHDAQARQQYIRVANPLLAALDRKVSSFENALQHFQWPQSGIPWDRARLALPAKELGERVAIQMQYGSDVTSYYKSFSQSFAPDAKHTLPNGEYPLRLSLNGRTEAAAVTIDDNVRTWGDVMTATAAAVNNAAVPVQAEVITQRTPEAKVPGVVRTGTFVGLFVEPARSAQQLELDRRDVLTRALDFDAAPQATRAVPEMGRYALADARAATPTTYISDVLDPGAPAGVTGRTYTLEYSMGPDSGAVDIALEEGATNKEMLDAVARGINRAQQHFSARVDTVDREVALTDPAMRLSGDGVVLTVTATDPKLAERLRFGPATAVSFWDPAQGLPPKPEVGPFIASSTANGWTRDNMYTWNGASWDATTPTEGETYTVRDEAGRYTYTGSGWSGDVVDDIVAAAGLGVTAGPGTDATLSVDGVGRASASGSFSLDRGRVTAHVAAPFAETLPLQVVEAMEVMEGKVADTVNGYNGVRQVLLRAPRMFTPDAPDTWRDTVADRGGELGWLGFFETGPSKLLWVDGERFWTALLAEPERAEQALFGDGSAGQGLIPAWEDVNASVRAAGLDELLVDPQRLAETAPPWRQTLDTEEEQKLLDVKG